MHTRPSRRASVPRRLVPLVVAATLAWALMLASPHPAEAVPERAAHAHHHGKRHQRHHGHRHHRGPKPAPTTPGGTPTPTPVRVDLAAPANAPAESQFTVTVTVPSLPAGTVVDVQEQEPDAGVAWGNIDQGPLDSHHQFTTTWGAGDAGEVESFRAFAEVGRPGQAFPVSATVSVRAYTPPHDYPELADANSGDLYDQDVAYILDQVNQSRTAHGWPTLTLADPAANDQAQRDAQYYYENGQYDGNRCDEVLGTIDAVSGDIDWASYGTDPSQTHLAIGLYTDGHGAFDGDHSAFVLVPS